MHNLSVVSSSLTARTCLECAEQRTENLYLLGSRNVLELCVGPSLVTLEKTYRKYNIQVTGNDIDFQWKNYYPKGKWLIGDALKLNYHGFDTVVFAPPLSKGCSGKREDSLSALSVQPGYLEFLAKLKDYDGITGVLVLPGRSFATSKDRKETFQLLSFVPGTYEIVPLKAGRRQIVKYYDVYFRT